MKSSLQKIPEKNTNPTKNEGPWRDKNFRLLYQVFGQEIAHNGSWFNNITYAIFKKINSTTS